MRTTVARSKAKGYLLPDRSTTHYDRKLEGILRQAAAVFCARGYHQASMRDIARTTGVSLAGLYYYFPSKEHLLYLIQRHAFETLIETAHAALKSLPDPEQRLRAFIRLHLEYFLAHSNEMKVLTHEEASLEQKLHRQVHALKKAYYQLCFEQVEALKEACKLRGLITRVAVLALFGMMNWIYTWYNPKVDPDPPGLAEQITNIFLYGAFSAWPQRRELRNPKIETRKSQQGEYGVPGILDNGGRKLLRHHF